MRKSSARQESYLEEIKTISAYLLSVQTVEELAMNFEKIRSLFEKASFLRLVSEEKVKLCSSDFSDAQTEDECESGSQVQKKQEDYMLQGEYLNQRLHRTQSAGTISEGDSPIKESQSTDTYFGHEKNISSKLKWPVIRPVRSSRENHNSECTESYAEKNTEADEQIPRKTPFRLDLNDKIAFQKKLFKDDEIEMQRTFDILKSIKTLSEAKEYLSEIYHEKNWELVDEYAQRLWALVENSFAK